MSNNDKVQEDYGVLMSQQLADIVAVAVNKGHDFETIKMIFDKHPDISINLNTNNRDVNLIVDAILHPEYKKLLSFLVEKGLDINLKAKLPTDKFMIGDNVLQILFKFEGFFSWDKICHTFEQLGIIHISEKDRQNYGYSRNDIQTALFKKNGMIDKAKFLLSMGIDPYENYKTRSFFDTLLRIYTDEQGLRKPIGELIDSIVQNNYQPNILNEYLYHTIDDGSKTLFTSFSNEVLTDKLLELGADPYVQYEQDINFFEKLKRSKDPKAKEFLDRINEDRINKQAFQIDNLQNISI